MGDVGEIGRPCSLRRWNVSLISVFVFVFAPGPGPGPVLFWLWHWPWFEAVVPGTYGTGTGPGIEP